MDRLAGTGLRLVAAVPFGAAFGLAVAGGDTEPGVATRGLVLAATVLAVACWWAIGRDACTARRALRSAVFAQLAVAAVAAATAELIVVFALALVAPSILRAVGAAAGVVASVVGVLTGAVVGGVAAWFAWFPAAALASGIAGDGTVASTVIAATVLAWIAQGCVWVVSGRALQVSARRSAAGRG